MPCISQGLVRPSVACMSIAEEFLRSSRCTLQRVSQVQGIYTIDIAYAIMCNYRSRICVALAHHQMPHGRQPHEETNDPIYSWEPRNQTRWPPSCKETTIDMHMVLKSRDVNRMSAYQDPSPPLFRPPPPPPCTHHIPSAIARMSLHHWRQEPHIELRGSWWSFAFANATLSGKSRSSPWPYGD